MRSVIVRPGRWHYVFLLFAGFCLGWYGYIYADRVLYQNYRSWRFDREAARNPITVLNHGYTPPPFSTIGRLSLPSLNISAMVQEGVDEDVLHRAVGHIPATALPGQVGNMGLAGHRDTFFRGLRNVKARDQIRFTTADREFYYEVESVAVVDPDDIEVLASSQDKALTLVTCYPFYYVGSAPKRFIVRARQVSDSVR